MKEKHVIPEQVDNWIREEIFDRVPVSICVIDRDFGIVKANEYFRRKFGRIRGRRCYEAYKGNDAPCDDCRAMKTFSDGEVRVTQELGIDRDGNHILYVVRLAPLVEKDGSIPYIIEMATDITEVKFLQNQLREKQERYRLLFDEVPCYITIQDRDFKLLETNRMFKDHFGDHKGEHCYEVYKQRTEQCYPCPVAQTFEDGKVNRSEMVVTSKAGDTINVVSYTAPIRDAAGDIMAVMEMSTDITQIRQLQSQLTSLGLLIGSISHGIKGLLMGLDGGIYAMETGFEKNDQQKIAKGWEMVKRNVGRVRSMVLDILYYAKERASVPETIEAHVLAGEVAEIMRPKATTFNIVFNTDIHDISGDMEVDYKAVRSMLVNIIENAFEACRVDKEKTIHKVDFILRESGNDVVFEIVDDGIGMDRDTRNKIFTLFFSTKGTSGTGLGLFISNKIARDHGGSIEVESTLGKGSKFTIRLPRDMPSAVSYD